MKSRKIFFLSTLISLTCIPCLNAQVFLSRSAAVDSVLKNNPQILSYVKQVERQEALRKGSFMLDKTELWLEAPTADRFAVGVQQYFNFPSVYANEIKLQKENVKLAGKELEINKNLLGRITETVYLEMQFSLLKLAQLKYQDSIFRELYRSTEKRYSVGEAPHLEKVLQESKYHEVKNQLLQIYIDINNLEAQLIMLTGIKVDSIKVEEMRKYELEDIKKEDTTFLYKNPGIGYYLYNKNISQRNFKLQRSQLFPQVFVGYLNQGYPGSEILYRFRFGLAVPLWFPSYVSRIKAARIGIDVAHLQYSSSISNVKMQFIKSYSNHEKNILNVKYYEQTALKEAEEILNISSKSYKAGEISYFIYLQGLSQAMNIKMGYISAVKDYNQSIIDLRYLRGE
jgi:outer membrane protein, heavy metal efflux system